MSTREVPRMNFLPGCKVSLIVRLEDFGAADVPAPPVKPPHLRTGKGDQPLQVTRDGSRFVLTTGGAVQPGGPQGQSVSDDGRTFRLDGLIPFEATLARNGVRTADTASITIAYRDLPIDPRVIRAMGVILFMGTSTPTERELGIRGVTRGDRGPGVSNATEPLSVIADTWVDAQGNQRSNERFTGFADTINTSFPRGEPASVRIECTDNTRILIDQDAPPKLGIAADKPIDEAIASYLSNFPQMLGMAVEYRPSNSTAPRLQIALAKSAYKPDIGPSAGASSKLSVWDYITDACGALGLRARVEGSTVIIQRPRTLYATSGATRPDDPFQGRILPGGRALLQRTLVVGRNVLDIEFSRRFTRGAQQNVEVRCYDSVQGKTIVVRYPEKKDRVAQALPGNTTEQKWNVLQVEGITHEPTLRAIAQAAYEEQGRQELSCSIATRSLASYGGSNDDPDLLDVLAGDGFEIEVAREPEGMNSVGATEESIAARAERFLLEKGFDSEFAKAYGQAMRNAAFQRSFRTRNVKIDYTRDEGISWSAELGNYLVVRSDKALPSDEEEPVNDPSAGSPVKVDVKDA